MAEEKADPIRKKAEADHSWGYYSKLVENYPGHKEETGHTSHIAKEHPDWIRRSKNPIRG